MSVETHSGSHKEMNTRLLSSVKKALKVLEVLSKGQPELGVTEISLILQSHKSSIFRILMTLISEGFVEKNPFTNKYRLGLKVIDLASRSLQRFDLREQVSPFMEKVSGEINEIVHLGILDKNEVVHLDKKGEGQALTVSTRIGGRSPAHASAMGKVLLSGLSPEELTDVFLMAPLARLTPNTLVEIPKVKRELEKVRNQGFAIDNEESFPGIKCIAVPIKDHKGKTIAAVSTSVPKQRMGRERVKEIRSRMIEIGHIISQQIGAKMS